jgi:LysM repeat protein
MRRILRLAAFLLAFIGLMTLIIWGLTRKNAYTVYIGEKEIGSLKKSKAVTEEILSNEAIERLKLKNNVDVQLNEAIVLKEARVGSGNLLDKDKLAASIDAQLSYKVKATALKINNAVIAVMKDQAGVAAVKERILAAYSENVPNLESAVFVEQVSTEDIFASKTEIMDEEKVFALLTSVKKTKDVYTVEPGDFLSTIAESHNMSIERILELNPDIAIDSTLAIGQVLNIERSIPPVSVRTVEMTVRTEMAEAPIQFVTNTGMDKSYSKVLQQGVPGQKEVEVRVVRVNGVLESTEETVTKMLVEPVPRIEEVGSK